MSFVEGRRVVGFELDGDESSPLPTRRGGSLRARWQFILRSSATENGWFAKTIAKHRQYGRWPSPNDPAGLETCGVLLAIGTP